MNFQNEHKYLRLRLEKREFILSHKLCFCEDADEQDLLEVLDVVI